jgi:hypothetical protein
LQALVYSTTGLNRCPPKQFDAIDVDALRAQTNSRLVWNKPSQSARERIQGSG